MHDQFDVTLEDGDLLGEVELTTTLIIAASESEDHLSQEEIDRLLGVTPRRPARRRLTPADACAQQVAKSTGPLVRSERTYSPSSGRRSRVIVAARPSPRPPPRSGR